MSFRERIESNTGPDLRTRQTVRVFLFRVPWVARHLAWIAVFIFASSVPGQQTPGSDDSSRSSIRLQSDLRVSSPSWTANAPSIGLPPLKESQATELYDRLNATPVKWYLSESDCDARIIEQSHLAEGGIDGRPCELVKFSSGQGSEALMVYPIEPIMPIDALSASVALMSAKPGARIGFRIRFPHLQNATTRRHESVIVYGTSYTDTGHYQRIGIGKIERPLRMQSASLRRLHGIRADLSDAFVDAVVLNIYSGPGSSALRVDELRVSGMFPVSLRTRVGARSAESQTPSSRAEGLLSLVEQNQRLGSGSARRSLASGTLSLRANESTNLTVEQGRANDGGRPAFAHRHITKIIQHNGEPLRYLRTLGFDAVLLNRPADIELLREARLARVLVYSPPPSAPDPSMEPYMEPLAGWHLGSGRAADGAALQAIREESRRLRTWPSAWQRPLLVSPLEELDEYAQLSDAIVQHFPTPSRGLPGGEEVAACQVNEATIRRRNEYVVGVSSQPAESLIRQCEAIARGIGAPPVTTFNWHAMMRQAIQALERSPNAILFSSSRSLVSGSELATQRASALSYVNRLIGAVTPWAVNGRPLPGPRVHGATYRCARLNRDEVDVFLLTTDANRGAETLAGDGATLTIQLAPEEAASVYWRVSHFSAERMSVEVNSSGASLSIVSPDHVEIIVRSSNPIMGARLAQSFGRFAEQAATDRWQLVQNAITQTRTDHDLLLATSLNPPEAASSLLQLAEQTMLQGDPMRRAGERDAWFRQARRADAWMLRSRWQLTEQLMPDWPNPTSSPPVDLGALSIQAIWQPLMSERGWSPNRLTSGGLDSDVFLGPGRWELGRRLEGTAHSEVAISQRGAFAGAGALRASATALSGQNLPGGYAGTVVQIRSPSVELKAGTAVRIDAMVRTIGFGDPHQGVLMHDSIGGQAMGVLLRGQSAWTPVRLYRQTLVDGEVRVMFELIGSGEVLIDEVQLSVWDPAASMTPPVPTQPILPSTAQTPQGRSDSIIFSPSDQGRVSDLRWMDSSSNTDPR